MGKWSRRFNRQKSRQFTNEEGESLPPLSGHNWVTGELINPIREKYGRTSFDDRMDEWDDRRTQIGMGQLTEIENNTHCEDRDDHWLKMGDVWFEQLFPDLKEPDRTTMKTQFDLFWDMIGEFGDMENPPPVEVVYVRMGQTKEGRDFLQRLRHRMTVGEFSPTEEEQRSMIQNLLETVILSGSEEDGS